MQQLFIEQYMLHRSARRAAVEAGYAAEDTAGWRLLQNKKIVDEIDRRKEAQRRRNELLEDEVLQELAKIAFVDITDVVDFSGSSLNVRDLYEIPEHARAAIKKVTQTSGKYGDNITVELHDKNAALEKLGKYLDMWTERVKVEGGDSPVQHEHRVAPALLEDRIKALTGPKPAAEDWSDL
jgi:phage terminase small subunit